MQKHSVLASLAIAIAVFATPLANAEEAPSTLAAPAATAAEAVAAPAQGDLPAQATDEAEPSGTADGKFHAGRDYTQVVPALPTAVAPGTVEVLEFFWYGCPHCFEAEEHIKAWLAEKPGNVVFTRVPATLSRGWVLMAQAFYTAEQLGVLDVMHPALFSAFHEDRVMLGSPERLAQYFKDEAGVEEDAFAAAFNSPEVASRVQRADLMARRYRIKGVPTLAVNGRFTTNPTQARGYASMVEVADALVKAELQAQPE